MQGITKNEFLRKINEQIELDSRFGRGRPLNEDVNDTLANHLDKYSMSVLQSLGRMIEDWVNEKVGPGNDMRVNVQGQKVPALVLEPRNMSSEFNTKFGKEVLIWLEINASGTGTFVGRLAGNDASSGSFYSKELKFDTPAKEYAANLSNEVKVWLQENVIPTLVSDRA